MAGVNVKVGVSGVAQFKADITKTKDSLKTLDAQLALNEKQFRNTGDAEEYMRTKAEKLKEKLEAQKSIAESAQTALENMTKNGVDKSSKSFQDMLRTLVQVKSDMLDTETQIKSVGTSAETASTDTEKMNEELKNVGKNVSWENVTSSISKITDGMEKAARTAIRMGKNIARSMMDSTEWADDLLTRSTQFGIGVEELQKMERVAEFVDTEVDTILTARDRLAKNHGNLSEALGITEDGKSMDDLFWEAGNAIMAMTDEMEQSEAAQKVFGKSWRELAPLFAKGRTEYESMMESQNVLTKEQVEKLGKADDAIKSVKQQVEQMKNEFWANNADKVTDMLQWLVDHKEEVKNALIVIGGGFGLLKLAEHAANLIKLKEGLKTLGLFGGAGGGGLGGVGQTIGAEAGSSFLSSLKAGLPGVIGASLIAAGFAWAAGQRNNNPEAVRGTEANLMSQTGNADSLLADYILAQKAMQEIDIVNAAWEEVEALQNRIDETREALLANEHGQDALNSYSDWRQEHSYGNMDWVLPESLQRMTEVAETLAGTTDEQNQTNNSLTGAVGKLEGLPAAIARAVENADIRAEVDIVSAGTAMTPVMNQMLASMFRRQYQ